MHLGASCYMVSYPLTRFTNCLPPCRVVVASNILEGLSVIFWPNSESERYRNFRMSN